MMASLKLLVDILLALVQVLSVLWPLWILAGLGLSVKLALKLYKAYRLSQSGFAELDKMEGLDFEKYLEGLFCKLGYTVKRTPYQGDYGADLVIQKAGVRTVVQAKRYSRSVGVKAVQEAVTAKSYYHCHKAIVVTNCYYSEQAKKLAKANRVELWDRDNLVNALLSVNQQSVGKEGVTVISPPDTESLDSTTASTSTLPAFCALCGASVSPQVNHYCLSHQELYGGKIYCYEHQKVIRPQIKRKSDHSPNVYLS
jgi:restriction system protein